MNPLLLRALERCEPLAPQTFEHFLGNLLDEEPANLARLPGTPATVLAAQFTYYAKTSTVLSETLCRKREDADKLADIILRLSEPLKPAKKQSTQNPENHPNGTHRDSHKPACHACRLCS